MKRFLIVDTSKSTKAILKPAPLEKVNLDGFVGEYIKRTINVTLPAQYALLESTGRIDNFRRASGKTKKEFQGFFFNDSDVYKWIEAASYALLYSDNPELEVKINSLIEEIKDAQDENGYLDTYFVFDKKPLRWTNLKDMHELYCAGHLMQAAVAHHRAMGEDSLLMVAVRFADHIASVFGPDKREGTSGHPEVEMGLVELYRETKNRRYLDLAKFFLDERGKGFLNNDKYNIDHVPFVKLEEVVGHAVRMLYLCAGATDIYLETGDEVLFETLNILWNNLTSKKMYVTGGAGSRYEGEAFGYGYELPNRRAYAESCASIGIFMWNWRMLLATGNAKFADVMERSLYNGMLSGISLDGKNYFYVNPLEDRGEHRRQPWYDVACCPPNIARTLTSFPGYLYATSNDGLWLNFYESGEVVLNFRGSTVEIIQNTDYPRNGKIDISISADLDDSFTLFMRKPGWASNFILKIDSKEVNPPIKNGYIAVNKCWKGVHTISIEFPMKAKLIVSHPFIRENIGKVGIQRGPLIYCLEQVDNPDFDVWDLFIDPDKPLNEYLDKELLNGIVVVEGNGIVVNSNSWQGRLYSYFEKVPKPRDGKSVTFKAIPYYAWANRKPGPMVVWIGISDRLIYSLK